MDVLLHLRHIRLGQRLQGGEPCKEGRRYLVDPLVGALRRQPHGEEQLVVLLIFQRADSLRVEPLELLHNGQHGLFLFCHIRSPLACDVLFRYVTFIL